MVTVKEWLRRGWRLNDRIDDLLEERHRMFELATGVTSMLNDDKVSRSAGNSTEEKIMRYTEYSVKIDKMIDELISVKQEIIDALNTLDDGRLHRLLFLRYIEFKTWEEIACKMNYDYRYVLKLHGLALKKISIAREKAEEMPQP